MAKAGSGTYGAIFRTKAAYRFDVGTLLMRLFSYTTTIGTITTLTLAGASAFEASSVASFIAICTFFVAPRVSRRIDERGQSAVVPKAALIAMAGLALMLATTHFGLPFWLNYVAAPLISFLPNAQALARARWTFLITSGTLGDDAPPLKTAYAYENVLEDIAFMVGPAAVIAVSAAAFPAAGMFAGAIVYCVGTVLMLSSTDTEPAPKPHEEGQKGRSVLATTPVVRVLFAIMIFFGAVYGAFDTAAISYTESIDMAMLASAVFAVESVFSVVMSFLFGLARFSSPMYKQVVMFAVLFGLLYGLFAFVSSPTSLLVIACISALSYAPCYITMNLACQHAVSADHLTEALSWITSGMSIGMVIGPVTAGAVIDAFTPLAGFSLAACFALAVIVLALCSIPVLRKHL
ncbi:MAG: hypothetical protein IJ111_11980 [Eggerthellaceae bacterium]|nr:hypothetical protein [Eggerthellaceae bacterium]